MATARAWVTLLELERTMWERQREKGPEYEEALKDCERKLQQAKNLVENGGTATFTASCFANLGPCYQPRR
jgi:hypothetical protein